MKSIRNPLTKKTIALSFLALSLTFVNVNINGWANTNNLHSETKTVPTQNSAKIAQRAIDESSSLQGSGTPQESAKAVVDLPQLPKTVTILKPAVESSFSEKKGRLNTLTDKERKKVGLALMFLGALAEKGS